MLYFNTDKFTFLCNLSLIEFYFPVKENCFCFNWKESDTPKTSSEGSTVCRRIPTPENNLYKSSVDAILAYCTSTKIVSNAHYLDNVT